ncbi:MAG: hypothetical protein ABFR36_01615 [Acidobacteriota bacterium]
MLTKSLECYQKFSYLSRNYHLNRSIGVLDQPQLVYNFNMKGSVLKLFEGRSIITYKPSQFTRDQALKQFLSIKNKYSEDLINCDVLRIDMDIDHSNLLYTGEIENSGSGSFYEFTINGSQNPFRNSDYSTAEAIVLQEDIKEVTLSTPYLNTDKRWDSVGLTAAPLFLGSALTDSGYNVNLENISLPVTDKAALYKNADLVGFTLFEDIILQFKEFLNNVPPDPGMLTAAGGPFISLSPLSAFYHFPEINIFVSGEGEIVFPKLLNAIRSGDIHRLLQFYGFSFQRKGLILFSDYTSSNIVDRPEKLIFHFNFSNKKELSNGLEMNFSRGCRNSCIFCSKVQGRKFRTLPVKNIEQLLFAFLNRIKELDLGNENSKVININDDDLLQDIVYARLVFKSIKNNNLTIWGIQSSITSFFHNNNRVKHETIDLISDKQLYKGSAPLIWLGTDTFIKSRGIRLGKPLPEIRMIYELISEFEKNGINNYHYWISSDHETTWSEFIEELLVIYDLNSKFPRFTILPHSPFLIPYPSTPAYKLINRSEIYRSRIKYRKIMKGIDPVFDLELVDHVFTEFQSLNRMLRNKKLPGKKGFFDYMKNGEFKDALICAYSFIKEERITDEKSMDTNSYNSILETEEKISDFITKII